MTLFLITEVTKPFIEYDMIQKHTSLPELAEYRLRLLMVFLNTTNQDQNQNEIIAIATSLVQLGLDTHDLVPVSNQEKAEVESRSRQLKVLAGDYFSSRFYHILAQAGQIEMIKQLSEAICEVNRLKMSLYLRMKQFKITAAEYLEQSIQIKLQLFLSFEHLIPGELSPLWISLLRLFTRGEVLTAEAKRNQNREEFTHSWYYWKILDSANKDEKKQMLSNDSDKQYQLFIKYNCEASLEIMIEENRKQLKDLISNLESQSLKQEVNAIYEAVKH